jgi:hypothetical protein
MMNCDGQVMNCGGQVMNCGGQVMMSCGGQVAVSQNARGFFRGKRWTAAAPRELTLGAQNASSVYRIKN